MARVNSNASEPLQEQRYSRTLMMRSQTDTQIAGRGT